MSIKTFAKTHSVALITQTRPCNIQQYFTAVKCSLSDEFFNIFLIFAQKYLGKPQFYHIEVGCKGVYITRTCLHDGMNDIK